MVKHIVMWKLKERAHGTTKIENMHKIKQILEALPEKINVISGLEVGFDFSGSEQSGDVVLLSEFSTRDALNEYRDHPDHQAVIPFIRKAAFERRVVDYEM
jgi:hypothetical protein